MKNHVIIYLVPIASDDNLKYCIEDYIYRNHLGTSWYLYRTENGKPLILKNDFYYSKTITEDFIAHAFSLIPLSIDFQKRINNDAYLRVAHRFYHPDELTFVVKTGIDGFYKTWCAKECYIKYYDLRIEKDFPHFSCIPLLNNTTKHLHYIPLELNFNIYGGLLTSEPVTYEFITFHKDH